MTAERWACARCGATNDPTAISCATCGLLRGSVTPPVPSARTAVATEGPPDDRDDQTPSALAEAPAPTESSSIWRRLPLGLIVGLGVVAVVGIGGIIFGAGRGESGEIERAGDLAAGDLRVGDCFDLKEEDVQEVGDVRAVPCAEPHEFEVIFVGDVPGDTFPTDPDTVFEEYVVDECLPAWDAFIGKAYEDSSLDIFYFVPTTDAWGQGDHSIQCAAYDPRDDELSGSLEGAAR